MRIVASLGGNAFVHHGEPLTMAGQFRYARQALCSLRPLLERSNDIVLTHGNGPQVGHILTRVEEALGKAYAIPLEVCVAESEGELGYVIEQTLHNLLVEWGIERPIASLLTQVVVDETDPAFEHPTKPIGPVYDEVQATELRAKGFEVRQDSDRGQRRVVPSPRPLEIVEIEAVRKLLEAKMLVVAAGGGGIPVVRQDGRLRGVEAVVDKDLASALLADALDAELFVTLTGVPCAYRFFGTPAQEPIGRVSVENAERLLAEGHFAAGSMRPKIEAMLQFVRGPGRQAIVCDPSSLAAALEDRAGTRIGALT